ncbi:hypothetical protein ACQ4PT_030718 [Festuca glaucescens]
MDRKGKNAAAKGGDLKRYFVPIASSSQSKPNTHEETPNVMPNQAEEQVEEGTENSSNPSTHESDIAHQEQEQEQELEGGQGTSEHVVLEAGGITDFVEYIKLDPRLRIQVDEFAPNVREDVRFAYLKNGPTQPYQHNFPPNRDKRSFLPKWFKQYDWLEYSVDKDKAYCFYCYLFKHIGHEKFGHDVFNKLGYDNWKNVTKAFRKHVGGPCSIHNISRAACDDFKNQKASVKSKVTTYTNESLVKYETRVDTSLGIVSYLALQGEPFRGHDESASSLNKGNFLEMLDWYKERNREVKLAFDELCPKNAKMTSSTIQKILARHCAQAVTKSIKEEMDGCLFSVLIDESRDISVKEQMAVVVRYVNKSGDIIERFLGIQHVPNTTSLALKKALLEAISLVTDVRALLVNWRDHGWDSLLEDVKSFCIENEIVIPSRPRIAVPISHQSLVIQILMLMLRRCVDLKSGKLVACPFCPMKKQDFCYNELLNHAIGVGAKHENDEQRKLNEVVRSLVEKHKKEKEAALNKILVLENLLDEKQMLELDLQQLEGNLGVMKHVEVLCQTEKMMNMDELQEKLAAIKHLDELNQTQERMAYDKLQCARKGLIKNDGQSCSFPTEGECSNHTSAVIQGTTSTVPRGVPVTRVSYLSRIKELECRKGWMMVVEVPESLSLQDTTVDPFVVQLGNDGGGTLRQLLKCFEQLWANSLCLRGNITKHNIYFVKESGIFEVHVTPDQIFQIDDAGFKLDTLGIVELLSVFKFTHKRYQSKQYPMYLLELVTELKSAGLDPEYFRNAKKRSLIHNSAVTMTPEQRAQVYTVIIRYWHAISEANLESFLDAMDPKTGLLRDLWLDKVKTAGSILYGRYTFNIGSYIDTYLSLTLYSRCLFEHGPTAKVSERQCEAALYLLNKEQFPRFQKQLLTVYKEVKPNVQTAGGSVVARPTVCPNVATQCLKHDDFGKVQLKFTEDSNQGF